MYNSIIGFVSNMSNEAVGLCMIFFALMNVYQIEKSLRKSYESDSEGEYPDNVTMRLALMEKRLCGVGWWIIAALGIVVLFL